MQENVTHGTHRIDSSSRDRGVRAAMPGCSDCWALAAVDPDAAEDPAGASSPEEGPRAARRPFVCTYPCAGGSGGP